MNKRVIIISGVIAAVLLIILTFAAVFRYNDVIDDVDTLETSFSEKPPKPPLDNDNEKSRPDNPPSYNPPEKSAPSD